MSFEFLEHTGDAAVELRAEDAGALFREAAHALTALYVDGSAGAPVEPRESVAIRLDAEDGETLLIDYLNDLIFRFDTDGFLCCDVAVEEADLGCPAHVVLDLKGETYDPGRHLFLTEVKAATFHDVEIRKEPDGLRTVVVFDL